MALTHEERSYIRYALDERARNVNALRMPDGNTRAGRNEPTPETIHYAGSVRVAERWRETRDSAWYDEDTQTLVTRAGLPEQWSFDCSRYFRVTRGGSPAGRLTVREPFTPAPRERSHAPRSRDAVTPDVSDAALDRLDRDAAARARTDALIASLADVSLATGDA